MEGNSLNVSGKNLGIKLYRSVAFRFKIVQVTLRFEVDTKEGLIKAYCKDYTEDYIAMGAIEILTARYTDKGQKYFGDGKVSIENLMMAERYFRWAFELNPGPMKKWLHPRLLYIYEKLGYTSRSKT